MESIIEKIIGTWRMVACTYDDLDGTTKDFFGKDPEGILMYDAHGNMNAQFMMSRRQEFGTEGFLSGTPLEIEDAFKSYQAYFGKYYQTAENTIVHEVEGSLFPNWKGQKQIRYAFFEGEDTLIYKTPPLPIKDGEMIVDAVWERVK